MRDLKSLEGFVDNEYLEAYCDLIVRNLSTRKEKFRTQRHHIIPKFYFKAKGLPIDDSESNTVNLLYKDHILAHYYLCLCLNEKRLVYRAEHSFLHLINGNANTKKRIENLNVSEFDEYQKIYEEFKILNSELTKGYPAWNKGLTKETDPRVARCSGKRIFSESHNRNLSKAIRKYFETHIGTFTGKRLSEEARKKISLAHKGKYFPPKDPEAASKNLSESLKKRYSSPEHRSFMIMSNPNRKEVCKLDSSFNVIKEYPSGVQACLDNGLLSKGGKPNKHRMRRLCQNIEFVRELGCYFVYKKDLYRIRKPV